MSTGMQEKIPFFYRVARFLSRLIFGPLFSAKIIRGENCLPDGEGIMIASNHLSSFDPILMSIMQRRPVYFMAKLELFKIWPVGAVCRNFGAIPVARGGADIKSVERCIDVIKSGAVFGIYVEGHRHSEFSVENGKAGAVMIAHRAGAPIYPYGIWSKTGRLTPFCRYTVAFGEPVTTEQLGIIDGTKAEYREATRRLMEIIGGLREECIAARAKRKKRA